MPTVGWDVYGQLNELVKVGNALPVTLPVLAALHHTASDDESLGFRGNGGEGDGSPTRYWVPKHPYGAVLPGQGKLNANPVAVVVPDRLGEARNLAEDDG
jgi:hypothetical protein